MHCSWLRSIAILMGLASVAHADFIVAIGAGSGTDFIGVAPTSGSNGQLMSRDFSSPAPIAPPSAFPPGTQVNNDDYTGIGASNPNQALFSLDLFNEQPARVSVTVQPATSVPPPGDLIGSAEYFLAVTVRNLLDANGNGPGLFGLSINELTVTLIPGTSGAAFDNPRNPAYGATGPGNPLQPYFPISFPASNTIRFGGPSGGLLSAGDSNTLFFSIDIPGSSSISPPRVFTLQFEATAVPEPGSLTLVGIGALGLASAAIRRQRRHSARLAAQ